MNDAMQTSVIIVGGGPAGLTAAIALAEENVPTVLVGKRPARPDNRTTALLASSVTALKSLGVWETCAPQTAPLRVMRIVDDTGRLWRAPEVKFEAGEIGLDAFGYNIENRRLVAALAQKAHALPSLRIVDAQVSAIEPHDETISVHLKDGTALNASLVVGADGRKSLAR
ncbi:MAG: FAD-dependent oxidoreductase, partial [Pseudolabrys sp.]